MQIAGMASIFIWTTAICVPFLLALRWSGTIRQPLSLELVGHDIAESGGLHKGIYRKMKIELYGDLIVQFMRKGSQPYLLAQATKGSSFNMDQNEAFALLKASMVADVIVDIESNDAQS